MPFARERLHFEHSLLSNKFPATKPVADYHRIAESEGQVDPESFGLFDSSSPNFNTYYPGLEPDELLPQEADFVFPLFRALSQVVLNKFGPLDFTRKGVLEASAKLLVGQTIYNNHEQMIGNDVGAVVEASFENRRKYDGVSVPGGINAKLKIDGKAHVKLARSIMADPPSVHSVSVTVAFSWVQSHLKMDRDEFFNKLGTRDDKGQLIRRVVDKILLYDEISLVPHGADPYAKAIQNGKLVNPADSSRRDDITQSSFSAEDFEKMGHFFDYKTDDEVSLTGEPFTFVNDGTTTLLNINNKKMNDELLTFLREKLGLADDVDEAAVSAALQERLPSLIEAQSGLDAANVSIQDFEAKYPDGSTLVTPEQQIRLDGYEGIEKIANTALQSTKDEAVRLYNIISEGKPDDAVLKMIAEGNFETVVALNKQYRTQSEKLYSATCNDCGSTSVTRTSAANPKDGIVPHEDSTGGGGNTDPLSNEEVAEKLRSNPAPAGGTIYQPEQKEN